LRKHPDGPGNAEESLQVVQVNEFVQRMQSELQAKHDPVVVKLVEL
jgi:hypothetical protein